MMKSRSMIVLTGILLTVTIAFVCTGNAQETQKRSGHPSDKRSDIVTIDILKDFGPLERSEVQFLHDLHTDTLEKRNKGCITCHPLEKEDPSPAGTNRLSLKFKRLEDPGKKEVMDLFHAECMSCHKEMSAQGEKTGPLEACGECHLKELKILSSRQPMGFDRSLHFRHSEANMDIEIGGSDCKICHHEYNKETKNLFYARGKEGSCRYCHKTITEENRVSIRLASHQACVDCHRKNMEQNLGKTAKNQTDSGPIKCSGCHDLKKQQMIERVEDAPRIKRGQPDIVLIPTGEQETAKQGSVLKMNPVPFDHQAHERYNDTCIECHHASLDSCTENCHTQGGSKKGGNITLERAMHQRGAKMSCMGCHEINRQDKNCAGCHTFIEKTRKQEDSLCLVCHVSPPPDGTAGGQKPEGTAGLLLRSRKSPEDLVRDEDIPEKVIIGELFYQYGAVEFPHGRIVRRLVKNIKENKLAGYFHIEGGTICQGCHHNSPATKKPPGCLNCHGKPFDEKNPFRPGLKAAYHQQCFGCHKKMGIVKPSPTGCTDCHKEVGLPQL